MNAPGRYVTSVCPQCNGVPMQFQQEEQPDGFVIRATYCMRCGGSGIVQTPISTPAQGKSDA